jgi:hypothetical protein
MSRKLNQTGKPELVLSRVHKFADIAARLRRLRSVSEQFYLAATAQHLKRLRFVPAGGDFFVMRWKWHQSAFTRKKFEAFDPRASSQFAAAET